MSGSPASARRAAAAQPAVQTGRGLRKHDSDSRSNMNASWLNKLTTYIKSLSALDHTSRDRALDALDVAVEQGPEAADDVTNNFGEQRSSRTSASVHQRGSRASPHDSAYIHRLRAAEAARSKGGSSTATQAHGKATTSPGVLGRLRRYVSLGSSKSTAALETAPVPPLEPPQPPQRYQLAVPEPRSVHEDEVAALSLQLEISTPEVVTMLSHASPISVPAPMVVAPEVQQRPQQPERINYEDRDSAMRAPTPQQQPAVAENSPDSSSTQAAPSSPKSTILAMSTDLPPGMARDVWCIEDYEGLQQLHSGYASFVMRATCRHSGRQVALKIYQPELLHKISQHQLMREARLHVRLTHKNIIRLYAAFQQEDGVVLVQEYAESGDLLHYLGSVCGGRMSERRAARLVIQPLLEALAFLHARSIIHRDIKLENILFAGPDMCLKLGDFGLCVCLREERSVTRAGTLDYMAPEVLRCPTKDLPEDNKDRLDLAYTCAVDIWSVGVLTYELVCGVPPFTRREREETERLIMGGGKPQFLVAVSNTAENFIHSCLERDSYVRPSALQLLRHPWLKVGMLTPSVPDGPSRSNIQLVPQGPGQGPPSSRRSLAAKAPSSQSRPPMQDIRHEHIQFGHAEALAELLADEADCDDRSAMFLPNVLAEVISDARPSLASRSESLESTLAGRATAGGALMHTPRPPEAVAGAATAAVGPSGPRTSPRQERAVLKSSPLPMLPGLP